jgi:hypothetical protein
MPLQTSNAPQTKTAWRASTNPLLQHLPKFDGTRKGIGAKTWIADLIQRKTFYNLSDAQMIPWLGSSVQGRLGIGLRYNLRIKFGIGSNCFPWRVWIKGS